MSVVTDILDTNQIHDLWGSGFTITPRAPDLFEALPPEKWPRGMSYQWLPIKPDEGVKVVATEWTPVPYSRHEGVYAPWGTPGDIEHGGLRLCEKRAEQVARSREVTRQAVLKQTEDWMEKAKAIGFTGHVRVGHDEETAVRTDIKTIETTTLIPREMTPYIDKIFAERDRLEADVVKPDRTLKYGDISDKFYAAIDADKSAPWWPTLRAILMPIAVENVRKTLKETTDGRRDGRGPDDPARQAKAQGKEPPRDDGQAAAETAGASGTDDAAGCAASDPAAS